MLQLCLNLNTFWNVFGMPNLRLNLLNVIFDFDLNAISYNFLMPMLV